MLFLCFFVIFYTNNQQDNNKAKNFFLPLLPKLPAPFADVVTLQKISDNSYLFLPRMTQMTRITRMNDSLFRYAKNALQMTRILMLRMLTLLPLVVIFAPLSIAQASLTLPSLIAKIPHSSFLTPHSSLLWVMDQRGDDWRGWWMSWV